MSVEAGSLLPPPPLRERRWRTLSLYSLPRNSSCWIKCDALVDPVRQCTPCFSMKIIAFELNLLVTIEHQAVHMARAICEPGQDMTVWTDCFDPRADLVIFVIPQIALRFAKQFVAMVFTNQIARRIEENLHSTVSVVRLDETPTCVVREPLLACSGEPAYNPAREIKLKFSELLCLFDGHRL